jgi:hypothetical protein
LDWIVGFCKVDGIEESIDDFLLSVGEFGSILVHREDNTDGSVSESVEGLLSKMDSMHLEVISSIVDCML